MRGASTSWRSSDGATPSGPVGAQHARVTVGRRSAGGRPGPSPRKGRLRLPLFVGGIVAVLAALTASAQPAPEIATGRTDKPVVEAAREMVVTAHPLATRAGFDVLVAGGSAVDAAIASALALAVVEPQSSGIGGGGFLLAWDAAARRLRGWDGRETAPAGATPALFLADGGRTMRYPEALRSGRAVGVPGLVRMFELAHRAHGRLQWARLFADAVRLAEEGFPVSPRLAASIARDPLLAEDAAARRVFFRPDGKPLAAGDTLRNPELAEVLRRLAREGAAVLHEGDVARDIVAAVRARGDPGATLSVADLAGYRATEREPVCITHGAHRICGMPPPTAGGVTTLQIVRLLAGRARPEVAPDGLMGAHLFAEASRLAYADRDRYVADPAFVDVPIRAMLDERYLAERRALIDARRAMEKALPGRIAGVPPDRVSGVSPEVASTTHLSVVDRRGNVVALTATVESAFGSRLMARGILLNNQLTDFSFLPERADGVVANRVEGGKRPRSAMAPTIVFDRTGAPVMTLGSPGGPWILGYVARALVAVLDQGLTLQQAFDLPHVANRNGLTELERGTAAEALRPGLELLGHQVRLVDAASGLHGIERTPRGWRSGIDPRREGAALGR